MKHWLLALSLLTTTAAPALETGWSGDTQWFRTSTPDFDAWHGFGEKTNTPLCPITNGPILGSCVVGTIWGWPSFAADQPAPAGCMVYGPYQDFVGRGTIHGTVRIRSAINPVAALDAKVFRVDITSRVGQRTLAQHWVTRAELKSHGVYASFDLSLQAANVHDEPAIEMRVCDLAPRTRVLVEGHVLYFTYQQ